MLLAISVASGTADAQEMKAREHLDRARAMLERIPASPAGHEAEDKAAELRAHFVQMTEALDRKDEADWKLRFSDVERDLAKIIGGGTYSTTPSALPVDSAAGVAVVPSPVGTAGQTRVVAGTGAQVAPASGVVPTSPGSIGGGQPAPAGTLAAVPAPGTPAAAGAPLTPASPTVLAVAGSPQVAASQGNAAAANAAAAGVQGAVSDVGIEAVAASKVSVIGIKDLDNTVRRQFEQFRTELEMFYTKIQSEASWEKR